jgi:hypothetical protein
MHWLKLISGPIILAISSFAAHGAETGDARFSVTVKLTVSASESIKESVASCLTRELRVLKDVRLVDDRPDWEIGVLALDVQSTRGYRGGIALSTVALPRFQNEKIAQLLRPAEKESGLAQTSNLWEYPAHSLHLDASDRLQVMCKQIAAEFDAKQVEKSRRRSREARELPQSDRLPPVEDAAK